ncbi:hypothetical protein O0880_09010 [Janthinobacterium sp. SUN118]|uniref:hypothetical protein n=1 Tax=Janthinobacterium sp. SUN118 TaxID=3004100 RepID=UPI0025AF6BC6|nr:hypothetical protein [Janthinobacterium sp. SUN118]MDN2709556.1 hypothetical protein [Janthinobacterium sp. SUN118]
MRHDDYATRQSDNTGKAAAFQRAPAVTQGNGDVTFHVLGVSRCFIHCILKHPVETRNSNAQQGGAAGAAEQDGKREWLGRKTAGGRRLRITAETTDETAN